MLTVSKPCPLQDKNNKSTIFTTNGSLRLVSDNKSFTPLSLGYFKL